MNICFIFPYLQMGGCETLLIRMSRWLIDKGHRVTVLTRHDGMMASAFPQGARVVVDQRRYETVLYGGATAANSMLAWAFQGEHVDVFYALTPDALWVAAALVNAQSESSKCLAGVYRPGSFVPGTRLLGRPRMTAYCYPAEFLFQNHLPPCCRLYMNEAVKELLESHVRAQVPGVIWPLPVDGTPYRTLSRNPEPGLIVSVGQLVPAKEYNLWMINVIDQLVSDGYDVRWEVYGDGVYRDQMAEQIRATHLEDRIALKGTLPYEQLGQTLSRAHVFVGMGTSLIEAGYAGVPAVVATGFDLTGMSYGFLHDLPEYACGEPVDRPQRPVVDIIKQVLAANDDEYARLATADREHAKRFDLHDLMTRFMDILKAAPLVERLWRPTLNSVCASAYGSAVRAYSRLRPRRTSAVARAGQFRPARSE